MGTGFQVRSALGSPCSLSMFGVLGELGKYPFVASCIVLSEYGIEKKYLFSRFLSDNLVENWATCFRMYGRNASIRNILMITIVSGDTPVRYIVVAAP